MTSEALLKSAEESLRSLLAGDAAMLLRIHLGQKLPAGRPTSSTIRDYNTVRCLVPTQTGGILFTYERHLPSADADSTVRLYTGEELRTLASVFYGFNDEDKDPDETLFGYPLLASSNTEADIPIGRLSAICLLTEAFGSLCTWMAPNICQLPYYGTIREQFAAFLQQQLDNANIGLTI